MIVKKMTDLIGNTPLLKLDSSVTGLQNIDVYAKLEMLNPFGSVKDRTAWAMVKDDIKKIQERNMTIYENSSGNTAKSLQAIASIYGIKFHLISSLAKVDEQKQVLQIMGASIQELSGSNDCFDPSDNNDPQYLLERTAKSRPDEIFFTSQFTNQKNPNFHELTTGEEIAKDLKKVDFFFNGLGTSGSSLGISIRLKKDNVNLNTIAVIPDKGHFLPGIQSFSNLWENSLYREDQYDQFVSIKEQEAIDGMLTLNRKCGVLCGVTAGANYYAAIKYLSQIDETLTERKTAVFIVCDRMEWYISYLKERRPEIFHERVKRDSFASFDLDSEEPAKRINVDDLEFFIKSKSPIIIDIRSPMAFKIHRLPNAINIPQEIFDRLLNQTDPFPKDKPILLVCAVGERTQRHAAYMMKKGYDAYSLEDGIQSLIDRPELLAA